MKKVSSFEQGQQPEDLLKPLANCGIREKILTVEGWVTKGVYFP